MQRRLGRLSGRDRYSAILAERNSARATYLQLYIGRDRVDEAAQTAENSGDYTVKRGANRDVNRNVNLGIGVAKALAKHATQRNYMRRVLREEMRKVAQQLPPIAVVILVRKAFDRSSRAEAVAELATLMQKLKLCVAY